MPNEWRPSDANLSAHHIRIAREAIAKARDRRRELDDQAARDADAARRKWDEEQRARIEAAYAAIAELVQDDVDEGRAESPPLRPVVTLDTRGRT